MQEYINHSPDLFLADEDKDTDRAYAKVLEQMNDKLIQDESLELEKRTFFNDSELAKKALAEAMKKGRK